LEGQKKFNGKNPKEEEICPFKTREAEKLIVEEKG